MLLNHLNLQQEMEQYNLHLNYVIPFINNDILTQTYIQNPFLPERDFMCSAFSCYNCERAMLHAMPENADWKKKAQASSIVYETSPKANPGANGFTLDTLQRLKMVPETDKSKPFYVYDEKLGRKRRHDPWFANHNPLQKQTKYTKKPDQKTKTGFPYNSKSVLNPNPNQKSGRKKNYSNMSPNGSPNTSPNQSSPPPLENYNPLIPTPPIVKAESSASGLADIYLIQEQVESSKDLFIKQERPIPGLVHNSFNPQEERDFMRPYQQNVMNLVPFEELTNQARVSSWSDPDILRTNAAITNTTVSEYVNILGNDDFDWSHHLLSE